MKKYVAKTMILVLFLASGCTNEAVQAVFKSPTVEIVSAYAVAETVAEATVDVSDVFQNISIVGVVWSEKTNPTTADRQLTVEKITTPQLVNFLLPNLQSGKTYFLRSYYVLDGKTIYGTEFSFTQMLSGEWRRLSSPKINADEYMYANNTIYTLTGESMTCFRVNKTTGLAVPQVYFRGFDAWNPTFFGREPLPPKPAPLLYSPIFCNFEGVPDDYTLYGGGYSKITRDRTLYQRAMFILQVNGRYTPYPGAEVGTSSFGIGKFPYVLENQPNGKLWRFNYDNTLSWTDLGRCPFNKPARFISFDIGERAFMLVEPENWQDPVRELHEYLPAENKWVRRADFVGENRRRSTAFVIGRRAFFGMGQSASDYRGLRDLWEYNPTSNSWRKAADFPGSGTVNTMAVGYNTTANIGFGQQARKTSVNAEDYRTAVDFWQFQPR